MGDWQFFTIQNIKYVNTFYHDEIICYHSSMTTPWSASAHIMAKLEYFFISDSNSFIPSLKDVVAI
jgi:hypothetical protein